MAIKKTQPIRRQPFKQTARLSRKKPTVLRPGLEEIVKALPEDEQMALIEHFIDRITLKLGDRFPSLQVAKKELVDTEKAPGIIAGGKIMEPSKTRRMVQLAQEQVNFNHQLATAVTKLSEAYSRSTGTDPVTFGECPVVDELNLISSIITNLDYQAKIIADFGDLVERIESVI